MIPSSSSLWASLIRRASPWKTSRETLRGYAHGIDASPERLAEVEDRLAALDRLRRKYGKSIDDVLVYGEEIRSKISQMENKDQLLRELKRELAAKASGYLDLARGLSRKRFAAARTLEKIVEAEINDLAMKARFQIEVSGSDEEEHWTGTGFDLVRYLISANPGEPLGPVEEIASGGELSRVMLALKASVEASAIAPAGNGRKGKDQTRQRTLVFDEIDSGIGGRAAEAVGRKLKALAHTKQVLCVTHLPQIASFADQHFLIEKRESAGRAQTRIRHTRRRRKNAGNRPHVERRQDHRSLPEECRTDAESKGLILAEVLMVNASAEVLPFQLRRFPPGTHWQRCYNNRDRYSAPNGFSWRANRCSLCESYWRMLIPSLSMCYVRKEATEAARL